MRLEYVPLLPMQRELHAIPRGYERFRQYLRTIGARGGDGEPVLAFPSLLVMNPMGRDHVTDLLDALLTLDADSIAAQTAAEASAHLSDIPGDFKLGLVVADDLRGGWTNRYATEFTLRFGPDAARLRPARRAALPRWLKDAWVSAVLWSSEPASAQAVRETVRCALHRLAYVDRHGPARTLRDMLAQEGHVLAAAGCAGPRLDAEEIAYTREVLAPYLDAEDMRTAIECLFGDTPAATLGFTPHGLSPWAGVALALHDARHR
ncbi:MAG: hypothetical protein U0793_04635 [Gemmataceae bacterium]